MIFHIMIRNGDEWAPIGECHDSRARCFYESFKQQNPKQEFKGVPYITHAVYSRRQYEVNTDPQRRCYNGCHFSSEMVWTDWHELTRFSSLEEAEESAVGWRKINPTHQYEARPI